MAKHLHDRIPFWGTGKANTNGLKFLQQTVSAKNQTDVNYFKDMLKSKRIFVFLGMLTKRFKVNCPLFSSYSESNFTREQAKR